MSPRPIWRCIGVRCNAKASFGFECCQTCAASKSPPVDGIADDANLVAGCILRIGQIAHMAENAADRRAEAMDDAQGFDCDLAMPAQNSRSRT